MFNDIEELMQTIDKFKTNVLSSEELLSVLKSTSHKLEQYEASQKDDKKQLLESFADVTKKIASDSSVVKNELKMLQSEIDNSKNTITKKINLILIGVAILALLIVILKFI